MKSSCALFSEGECDGPLEMHHVVRRATIKRLPRTRYSPELKKQLVKAEENLVPLCHRHHHRVTHKFDVLQIYHLPAQALQWARVHDLEWALEREVPSFSSAMALSDPRTPSLDSRAKGRRGEKEVEDILRARGADTDRYIGGREQRHADIGGLARIALDSKYRERILILKWSREHEASTPEGLIPVIAYRKSREPWRVSLPLEDFLDLCEEAGRV